MADEALPTATAGVAITGAELQDSIDRLRQWAEDLDAVVASATEVQEAQAAARLQQDLLDQALALVGAQIDLIAGEAQVAAAHINAATQYAQGVIARIADWKRRIEKLGQVLDFLAVLSTGSGTKIVAAAVTLKQGLDEA
jgi:hypothetical protein